MPEPGAVAPRLRGTHSHNDFLRRRPLADALERGFTSIEVDVALRDGTLYVTHDSTKIDRSATLAELYLTPLSAVAARNGGSVYLGLAPPLQLLVDVKSDGDSAYDALELLLADYGQLFTRWRHGEPTHIGAVTVIVSGNRPRERVLEDPDRRMGLDGRIWEDREGFPPDVMPLVSINWDDTANPRPDWPAGADRMEIARLFVEQVHTEGRRVRFWNTPDREQTWWWLRAIGADYIGTDDPRRLAEFLAPLVEPGRRE